MKWLKSWVYKGEMVLVFYCDLIKSSEVYAVALSVVFLINKKMRLQMNERE